MDIKRKSILLNQSANVNQVLPQYLATTPLTLIEGFESTTGWSKIAGDSFAVNNSEFVQGAASLKVDSGGIATGQIEKNPNAVFSAFGPNMILYVYPHSAAHDNGTPHTIYLSSYADYSKFFNVANQAGALSGFTVHAGRWNALDLTRNRWTNNSGDDWSRTMVKFKVRANTAATQTSWDNFVHYTGKPAIMISFDDGYASVYTKAFAYMNPRNIKGTAYVNPSTIDVAGNMTSAQLTEMYAAGWDIANHGNTHANWLTSTQAQIETDIGDAITTLEGWGFTRASHHVAYPYGSVNNCFDADVIAAMTSQSILTGRMVANFTFLLPGLQLWDIPTYDVPRVTTLATVQGWVDEAKANNKVIGLYFHKIVDSPSIDTEWSTANFQGLIDYIITQQIQPITINELYQLQSGAITVRMPWA